MVKTTAIEIVIAKARGYLYRGKYPQLIIFTKDVIEIDKLLREFGGNTYRHGTGHVWVLSHRVQLKVLMEKIRPHLPSKHGLESILRDDGD